MERLTKPDVKSVLK